METIFLLLKMLIATFSVSLTMIALHIFFEVPTVFFVALMIAIIGGVVQVVVLDLQKSKFER